MKLHLHQLRQVSVAASCDPRSVGNYVAGKTLRPLLAERIEVALRECGLGHLVRPQTDEPTFLESEK